MRFKIDENLPIELANLLAENGYDSSSVYEEGLNGRSDNDIAAVCKKEKRTPISLDTDFANITTYPPSEFYGLVVLKLRSQDKDHILNTAQRLLTVLAEQPLEHCLWIVEEHRIRINS